MEDIEETEAEGGSDTVAPPTGSTPYVGTIHSSVQADPAQGLELDPAHISSVFGGLYAPQLGEPGRESRDSGSGDTWGSGPARAALGFTTPPVPRCHQPSYAYTGFAESLVEYMDGLLADDASSDAEHSGGAVGSVGAQDAEDEERPEQERDVSGAEGKGKTPDMKGEWVLNMVLDSPPSPTESGGELRGSKVVGKNGEPIAIDQKKLSLSSTAQLRLHGPNKEDCESREATVEVQKRGGGLHARCDPGKCSPVGGVGRPAAFPQDTSTTVAAPEDEEEKAPRRTTAVGRALSARPVVISDFSLGELEHRGPHAIAGADKKKPASLDPASEKKEENEPHKTAGAACIGDIPLDSSGNVGAGLSVRKLEWSAAPNTRAEHEKAHSSLVPSRNLTSVVPQTERDSVRAGDGPRQEWVKAAATAAGEAEPTAVLQGADLDDLVFSAAASAGVPKYQARVDKSADFVCAENAVDSPASPLSRCTTGKDTALSEDLLKESVASHRGVPSTSLGEYGGESEGAGDKAATESACGEERRCGDSAASSTKKGFKGGGGSGEEIDVGCEEERSRDSGYNVGRVPDERLPERLVQLTKRMRNPETDYRVKENAEEEGCTMSQSGDGGTRGDGAAPTVAPIYSGKRDDGGGMAASPTAATTSGACRKYEDTAAAVASFFRTPGDIDSDGVMKTPAVEGTQKRIDNDKNGKLSTSTAVGDRRGGVLAAGGCRRVLEPAMVGPAGSPRATSPAPPLDGRDFRRCAIRSNKGREGKSLQAGAQQHGASDGGDGGDGDCSAGPRAGNLKVCFFSPAADALVAALAAAMPTSDSDVEDGRAGDLDGCSLTEAAVDGKDDIVALTRFNGSVSACMAAVGNSRSDSTPNCLETTPATGMARVVTHIPVASGATNAPPSGHPGGRGGGSGGKNTERERPRYVDHVRKIGPCYGESRGIEEETEEDGCSGTRGGSQSTEETAPAAVSPLDEYAWLLQTISGISPAIEGEGGGDERAVSNASARVEPASFPSLDATTGGHGWHVPAVEASQERIRENWSNGFVFDGQDLDVGEVRVSVRVQGSSASSVPIPTMEAPAAAVAAAAVGGVDPPQGAGFPAVGTAYARAPAVDVGTPDGRVAHRGASEHSRDGAAPGAAGNAPAGAPDGTVGNARAPLPAAAPRNAEEEWKRQGLIVRIGAVVIALWFYWMIWLMVASVSRTVRAARAGQASDFGALFGMGAPRLTVTDDQSTEGNSVDHATPAVPAASVRGWTLPSDSRHRQDHRPASEQRKEEENGPIDVERFRTNFLHLLSNNKRVEAIEQLRRLERSYVNGPKLNRKSAQLGYIVSYVEGRDRTAWSGRRKQEGFGDLVWEEAKLWGRSKRYGVDDGVRSRRDEAEEGEAVDVRESGVGGLQRADEAGDTDGRGPVDGGLERMDKPSDVVGRGAEAVQGSEQRRWDRGGDSDGGDDGGQKEQDHGSVEIAYHGEKGEVRAAARHDSVEMGVSGGEEGNEVDAERRHEQIEEGGDGLPIHGIIFPGLPEQGKGNGQQQEVDVYRLPGLGPFLENVSADDAKVLLGMLPSENDGEGSAESVRAAVLDWLGHLSEEHADAEMIAEALLAPGGIVDGLRRLSSRGVEDHQGGNRKEKGTTHAENETEGTANGKKTREERTKGGPAEVQGIGRKYSSSARKAQHAAEKARQRQRQRELLEGKKDGEAKGEGGGIVGLLRDTATKEQKATEKWNDRGPVHTADVTTEGSKDQQTKRSLDFSLMYADDWFQEISYGAWY